jgi:hypothetical protein
MPALSRLLPCCAALVLLARGDEPTRASISDTADRPLYGELRIYHPTPGKADAILERFAAGTWNLRRKHGLNPLACWVSPDRLASNAVVVQLLAPASEAAAREAWTNFVADPEFKALQAASEARHGRTVDRVETLRLSAPVNLWRVTNSTTGQPRVFDLRLYSRAPGKEAAFRDRWRLHAVRLYERHGMTSLGSWEATDPEHGGIMVTLFAHESNAAIDATIAAFHKDPEWQRIEAETEAGGKLRTNLTAFRLVPATFSPVK